MFQDLSMIKKAGFVGFKSIQELWLNHSDIPNEKGIYLILNPDSSKKQFLTKGVGGYFKDKDPNISLGELTANWVDNSLILYIGQAGGNSSSSTLKKRLKQYLEFGKGKPVGHYGGRLIWQLCHHNSLIVAWKIIRNADPRLEEYKLINEFHGHYGRLPFANLKF